MPDNKNQHYVPRCHLKPFSLNRDGTAINLYNHRRDIIRANVAIAGQCSKSYFYGQDLVIERALQKLEGRYAALVRRAEASEALDDAELAFLNDDAYTVILPNLSESITLDVHPADAGRAVRLDTAWIGRWPAPAQSGEATPGHAAGGHRSPFDAASRRRVTGLDVPPSVSRGTIGGHSKDRKNSRRT